MSDLKQLAALFVDVQSQMAFHDDAVATLNEVVASQQQEIMVLRQQLMLLKQRQDEQGSHSQGNGPGEMASHEDEKPPHY